MLFHGLVSADVLPTPGFLHFSGLDVESSRRRTLPLFMPETSAITFGAMGSVACSMRREPAGAGDHALLRDLAAAEKISPTYVSRLLRLTLLAPDIVERALDGCSAPWIEATAESALWSKQPQF